MSGDPLIPWLQAHGVTVTPHHLGETPIQLGNGLHYRHIYLAWRVDSDTRRVWILLLRREGERGGGLANPFAALYLLAEATRAVLGAGYELYGNVDVFRGSRLSGERLGRFYRHWTGASEPEPGWFALAVEQVCSLREMRKRQKHGLA
ncbi:LcrR family type III secretion system chaperone [Aeromonas salmonicida]|uniref:LcrR family type III secretion system chaperone n=1 Tax=Aeromonas salmonicida TaxID=645 RepID=UPI00232EBA59|nr:LcrR family type III secretion system chaperone [Aeromonas salmonicida]WCH23616.1 LcrR family type III secretion system chaperone [Aeromonas salmonicida]